MNTHITSWADPANIGAMYPFASGEFINGTGEVVMVVLAVCFWIGWHLIQICREKGEHRSRK